MYKNIVSFSEDGIQDRWTSRLFNRSNDLVVFIIAFTENRTGICVPERCDKTDACPSIGNGCREYPYGLVTGQCMNYFCNYSSTPQIMFKCLDPDLVVRGKSHN